MGETIKKRAGPAWGRWTSVKEGLPADGELVLVITGDTLAFARMESEGDVRYWWAADSCRVGIDDGDVSLPAFIRLDWWQAAQIQWWTPVPRLPEEQ